MLNTRTAGKLGRLDAKHPVGLHWMVDLFRNPLPAAPRTLDHAKGVAGFAMYGNDQYGDCVAEGTVVSAPDAVRGYRAPYSGPVIQIEVLSGERLTVTPNHAVLTPRGFTRARFLQEGDDVISARGAERLGRPLRRSDLNEAPAPVEQVVAALGRSAAGSRETAQTRVVVKPVDFHGDARFMNGDVDVVGSDSFLERELDPALRKPYGEDQVGTAGELQRGLHRQGATGKRFRLGASASLRRVGSAGQRGALLGAHARVSKRDCPAHAPQWDSRFPQEASEACAADAGLSRQRDVTFASSVAVEERREVRCPVPPESRRSIGTDAAFVAGRVHPSGEGDATDPGLVRNLFERFPGLVQRNRIVKVELHWLDGHVYDLSTDSRWYTSNGIITHNCTFAGAVNLRAADAHLLAETEVWPCAQDVIDAYLAYTHGQDAGAVESDLLEYWRTQGILGNTIVGHAPLHVGQHAELTSAMALFGGAYTGIKVPANAEAQFEAGETWHLTGSSEDDDYVGGHCVPLLGYTSLGPLCVTWGAVQHMTWAWWDHVADEAHAVITHEFVAAKPGVVNLPLLEADMKKLAA